MRLQQQLGEHLPRLAVSGGLLDKAHAHEIKHSGFSWGIDLLLGVFLEEDPAFKGDRRPQLQHIGGLEKLRQPMQYIKIAERRAVQSQALHLVGDARRRPALPIIGEKRVQVHIHLLGGRRKAASLYGLPQCKAANARLKRRQTL